MPMVVDGIAGTVHISTPSFNGVSSIGTAEDGTVLWSEHRGRDGGSNLTMPPVS